MEKYYGLYRGTVFSNKDPLGNRRLRLTVPVVTGEEATGWAWPIDSSGFHQYVPVVGQGVWVMFENGDPSFPIWVGTFGKYKGAGYQVKVTDFAKGTHPATVTRHIANGEFDVMAALSDLADKVEEIRLSLNAHGGGDTESPPTDVAP